MKNWKLEWNKIKKLPFRKRMEYLWEYYKAVLVILAAVILAVATGITMYRNLHTDTILSVVIVDADRQNRNYEDLETMALQKLGKGKQNENIKIDLSASSQTGDDAQMNLAMKLSIVEENDVIICNEQVYERFHKEHAFEDLTDLCETRKLKNNDAFILSDSVVWNDGKYLNYAPAYLCILNSSPNKERAAEFLKMFSAE